VQTFTRVMAVFGTAAIVTLVSLCAALFGDATACTISGTPIRFAEPPSTSITNRDLVLRFYNDVIIGGKLEQSADFLREDYIQHNPNVGQGRAGFVAYFDKLNKSLEGVDAQTEITMVTAEGDLVTISGTFVFATAFTSMSLRAIDIFRVEDGKIAEHWDAIQPCDTRSALLWALL
jgi:predicted SnoaL-like aldol condensation-catalyzing enzyme